MNPFCVAVNPAAGTRLGQSGDVDDGARILLKSGEGGTRKDGSKNFPEGHDSEQCKAEGE